MLLRDMHTAMIFFFPIRFHLGEMISDPSIILLGIWICLFCMKAASNSLPQRAETASGSSHSGNYMHIIFSAVDDREDGIFGNTLQIIFFLFPSESLLKWRALTGYIISLFLQLSHYFVCSAAGIIACSFGLCQSVLPVFKESNEANAAKMLIVLWSGSSAIHIQLTVKPVTTS